MSHAAYRSAIAYIAADEAEGQDVDDRIEAAALEVRPDPNLHREGKRMAKTTIPAGHEARVTCLRDPSRSRFLADTQRPLCDQLAEIGVGFTPTEMGWVENHLGAENDDWIVRVVDASEPLEEFEIRP